MALRRRGSPSPRRVSNTCRVVDVVNTTFSRVNRGAECNRSTRRRGRSPAQAILPTCVTAAAPVRIALPPRLRAGRRRRCPLVRIADPPVNAERTLALARQAAEAGAAVVVFPELGLSAYTVEDLFHQDALIEARARGARDDRGRRAPALPSVLVVGAPLRAEQGLFNTAVVIHRGRVLGVDPEELPPGVPRVLREAPVPGRPRRDRRPDRSWSAQRFRSASDLLFVATDDPEPGAVTSRSARTCGRRSRRAPTARWPARRCSRTCRPATSRSASPTTATCSAPRTRPARSPHTSTRPPGWASRPPTSPGMARR